jgi:3-phosphoshikimate 1-carboxyvinyltransferase
MTGDAITITPWPDCQQSPEAQLVDVPSSPDKSLTHRAMILAAMAQGCSVIHNPLDAEDCLATMRAFAPMGVSVSAHEEACVTRWMVDSPGVDQWRHPVEVPVLDLGNSGTSARLLTGLFSGITGLTVTLTGDESLSCRPMARVVEPLRGMGASISGDSDGRTLPLTITGTALRGRSLQFHVPSAQIKSAILLAATSVDGEVVMTMPQGSRDHTERMLFDLGANITVRQHYDSEIIRMIGPWRPRSFSFNVPGDPSSAAFFLALAALHPNLSVRCRNLIKNPTRVGFLNILRRMGCDVIWSDDSDPTRSPDRTFGEIVGDVTVSRRPQQKLKSTMVHRAEIATLIDEVPILAVVCSVAEGLSVIEGLSELRVKESNRFESIIALLGGANIAVKPTGDAISIQGRPDPAGFDFESQDHRMVMSACILATRAAASSRIYGRRWIQTSFPLFLPALQNIKAGYTAF